MSVQWIERYNRIPMVSPLAQREAARVINEALAQVHQIADPLTRRDTGALAGNIQYDYASAGNLEGVISWIMEYAVFQNGGTVFMSGTHFADNGAEYARGPFQSGMEGIGGQLA